MSFKDSKSGTPDISNLSVRQSTMGEKSKEEMIIRMASIKELKGHMFSKPAYQVLKTLDVRNNRLSELPEEICDLANLRLFRVDYNYLTSLPFALGKLSNLVKLTAS